MDFIKLVDTLQNLLVSASEVSTYVETFKRSNLIKVTEALFTFFYV
ncbi:hypothetical protein GGQ60_001457 [Pedobacter zeae]|uniref:Uncharacterized protein n=1 Tax=Pedobacter zeae TaxID=1737356 RepID=A0A7W6KAT3_9SPHI|nr:hypothetical protein [Pedobacter zeae]